MSDSRVDFGDGGEGEFGAERTSARSCDRSSCSVEVILAIRCEWTRVSSAREVVFRRGYVLDPGNERRADRRLCGRGRACG